MTTRIELNKDLSVDYTEWKKNITSKGYSYYDFSREEVERIAKKNVKEVSTTEIRTLAQALFPQYLQCSIPDERPAQNAYDDNDDLPF